MNRTLGTLWTAFKRYRWHVALLVLFGALSPLLEGIGINAVIPLMSFFSGGGAAPNFFTNATQAVFQFLHIPFSFRYLLGFILVLFFIRAVSVVSFGYVRGWIVADYLGKESEDVVRRTLLTSWAYLVKQKIGTVQNTLVRDVQQSAGLLGASTQVIQSVSGFLMYFVVAMTISPTMTLYALGGGATLFGLLRPLLRRTQKIGSETAGVEKQFAQFLTEHIIGMKSIKAAGAERAAIAVGTEHIKRLRHLSIRQALLGTLSSSFFQPASLVLVIVLFLVTYHTPEFSILSFAAALYLIQKIFMYLESGQVAVQSVLALTPYATNIAAFKRATHGERESSGGNAPFSYARTLSFDNVSFSYSPERPLLRRVQFQISRGETVGLVGPSGTGKSSIADLILRLFTPASGRILLDGRPSEDISVHEWRSRIGYVPQDVFLLHDTIANNVKFYTENISTKEIEHALAQANILDFVRTLPQGLDTLVGDRGVLLSGGQRQRIALARALAQKPELLILDEATSALDHESERLIHSAIASLRGQMTVLIIAHRPSTVADADHIIVLRDGTVAEYGTPEELLANPSSYFSAMQGV